MTARSRQSRGIALITVLFATVLLLALVAVLVDLGTIELQRSAASLRALQALAAADGGAQWARAILDDQDGDIESTIARLARTQGRHTFVIDPYTQAQVTVSIIIATEQSTGNHLDENLEENPQAVETPAQIEASATVYAYGKAVASRSTTTLLRVFPAAPYSEIVGEIDDGGPVGIDSPGDAGGQPGGANATELLVNAYTMNADDQRQSVSRFGAENWSDGNTAGSGPLP
jgi:hypothetical protein